MGAFQLKRYLPSAENTFFLATQGPKIYAQKCRRDKILVDSASFFPIYAYLCIVIIVFFGGILSYGYTSIRRQRHIFLRRIKFLMRFEYSEHKQRFYAKISCIISSCLLFLNFGGSTAAENEKKWGKLKIGQKVFLSAYITQI